MNTKKLVKTKAIVKDTKRKYYGDIGVIYDIRKFPEGKLLPLIKNKYITICWGKNSKHGFGYRNYKPNNVGKRFKLVR